MKYKHIISNEINEQNFGSVRVKDLLADDQYDKLSVAEVKIVGEQKTGLDTESDSVYYILEGEGKFFIEEEVFEVKKGDLIFIPKNTKYKDEGSLTLLAISSPKFDRSKRIRFD